jgi:hypothetical protein
MTHFARSLSVVRARTVMVCALSLPTAGVLGTPVAVAAQVATIDEGSFTITRNGEKIGREEFSIRRAPGSDNAALVASATIIYDSRRVSPALRADLRGMPVAYQVEVRSGSEMQERLTGTLGRGRFSALIKTPRGEAAKEYVVADGALILDDDVYHQYYFLAQDHRDGLVAVVVPRRNVQFSARVRDAGSDHVSIGGRALDARHLVMTEPSGESRDIWVDAQGRVLKVALAARGIVALRDDAPR